jgi:hypothetical protein
MARRVTDEIVLEDVRLIFRNFKGEERLPYNAKGDRNFSIPLDHEMAMKLQEIGWTVKGGKVREDGEPPLWHLPVKVSYKGRPPRIFTISDFGTARNEIKERFVHFLDQLEFDLVDVTLSPYNWDMNGRQGCSAYLKTFYGTVHEDPLDIKYRGVGTLAIEGGRSPEQLAIDSGLENQFDDEDIIDVEGEWIDEQEQLALPRGTE